MGKPFPIFIDFKAGRVSLPVDIYLLADNTGSMSDEISTVKRQFQTLINAVGRARQFKDPHFGVGSYQDEEDKDTDSGFRHLQSMTSLAQKAVNKFVAEAGGDRDEANLVALYKLATEKKIGWREGSRKIVVYFGDVPGHEPTCGAFGTIDRRDVTDALKKKKISVIAISLSKENFEAKPSPFTACIRSRPAEGKQASFIVKETNGELLDANSDDLVATITRGVIDLASTFTVDLSDCKGKVESTFVPSLPLTLPQGTTRTVRQTISVPERFCDSSTITDRFECSMKYLESGVLLPPTVLVVKKVKGCT